MSTSALRDWFRNELQALVPEAPYKETLNVFPDLRTPEKATLWLTLEFENAVSVRSSLGRVQALFRETGQVNIIVLGLSGKGDGPVVQVAEQVRNHFRELRGSLVIPGTHAAYYELGELSPPDTAPTEDGNWFMCAVSCPYKLDLYRDV